jgi:hypothetical protein
VSAHKRHMAAYVQTRARARNRHPARGGGLRGDGDADGLRRRGERVTLSDPGGDAASDRRLLAGDHGIAAGGVLSVRASSYISELEITASTGCHRG